ncbi:class I SAM-dependent methyltransferase [Candidatus Fonsibacter ubiquis]|uniref:class I SAM-dependent methyltransferase n=1 Tax=Candidatus Fonsibacter ubiquis TaxID=1925548 RepID=UPI000C08360F|nr:class I SAM-dependent methyltransferase [Candidatus Fonsibacter ubiquis]
MSFCKITKKKLKPFMSFGQMPLANGFLLKKDFNKEFFYNLETSFSEEISLFQINDHPKPKQMFNKHYPFFTSSSKFMIKHFKKYSEWVKKFLSNNSRLIEIGSNDGTFLENFKKLDIEYIGFEPSYNVFKIARQKKINTINKFFSTQHIYNLENFKKKTDVIVGSNVVCHIPDLVDFIKTVDLLLSSNGTLVFEEPYLGSMYEKVSYDQIYDEHIFLFSITSISKIFRSFDFDLVDVIPQITHGGSMRYILKRKKNRNDLGKVKRFIEKEKKLKIDSLEGCLQFKKNCEMSKNKLNETLYKIKKSNQKICGYGATSKSTTILNYCNIGPELIDCIFDTTKEKIGKFSPGMHIPIYNYKLFRKSNYNNVFLFAWNHKKEIQLKEKKLKNINWITHLI